MSVELKGIVKYFESGKIILNNLSFALPIGKFSGLLGPSGCGKTTLLRILAGLDAPNAGSISIDADTLVDTTKKIFISPEDRNIGMVFQSYAVWPHMTVFENVAFPLRIRKNSTKQLNDEVMNALKTVRLDGLEKRMPNALSGGQQQRVALARALVQKPRLLLLDEPLSNLDASLRESMRSEIRQLQEKLGITAIIVTHDWSDAKGLCDHIVVLHEGNIVQQATPQEIVSNPANSFVAQISKSS